MPGSINFDSPLTIDGNDLQVRGSSDMELDGATLISRRVAVQQGDTVDEGKADLEPNWIGALSASGFKAGEDAMAVGTETYLRRNPAAYFTLTWSEIVEIK